jgi:hypothetical protein
VIKRDFFLAAMRAEEFRRQAWVLSAFCLINEGPDDWKKDPYPYRIVQMPSGHFFVDPDNNGELSPIEGATKGEPIFQVKERIQLKKGEIINLKKDVDTTYGNLLLNYIVLVYPFKDKLDYMEGRFSPKDVEKLILKRLVDNPKEGETLPEGKISVEEYLNYADAAFATVAYTQMCVPAATEKTMTAAPGIFELRDKLLKENWERRNDPAVIAKIDAELVAFDKAYLKGDRGADYLLSGKAYDIVRKRQFGMHGAEAGLNDGVEVELIDKSLSEGWDISKFPAYNNSLRAGSFNRGRETMLGGESVKWLFRASSNVAVTEKDCGSKIGNEITVDGDNYNWIVGFWLIGSGEPTLVPDAEEAKKCIGKTVSVRSPMYCKLEKTDYCECCVGVALASNPTALSAAITDYGSVMMYINMQAVHGKKLSVQKLDWQRYIF